MYRSSLHFSKPTYFARIFMVPPDQHREANAVTAESMSSIITDMSNGIRDCGNLCQQFYGQSFVGM
jgi:hypothetical protein